MALDKISLIKLTAAAAGSAALAYYIQPLIHQNKGASDVLVNVFSILAGFLVAVMTIMSEPIIYRKRNWRYNKLTKGNYRKSLIRHKDLFHAYLITLVLIFSSRLVNENDAPCLKLWSEYFYIFFACISFFFSIGLPDRLISKQLERFDEQIEEKKNSKE
ncbi:hypothetical protein [Larsenimonas suaedae]|uniref:Uncharacterized protein n=1 Tax=Larsenimonas suaedae TaxID=1851019 RepID=A0ABU1GZ69_9GAMM|nr:hypothetical protein [Larsenimonas suaedae]MCM2973480.1 hypothetical protein [Larsenimonas suaedae]MDR5897344.1 hypothetical protein [Larsenimonas suaedae]